MVKFYVFAVLILILIAPVMATSEFGYNRLTAPTITVGNGSTLNTNHSNSTDYWNTDAGSLGTINETQFSNNGGYLNILESWITSLSFWNRTGTTLTPSTTGDNIETTGNATIGITSITSDGTNGKLDLGSSNTIIGQNAGAELTSGTSNTFIGAGAGSQITTTGSNLYLGETAGAGVVGTTGTNNVAIGRKSMQVVDGGINNVAIGYQAGIGLTDGNSNTLLGFNAGESVTTGSGNIIIGNTAGKNLVTTASNYLVINNGESTDPLLYGYMHNAASAKWLKLGGDLTRFYQGAGFDYFQTFNGTDQTYGLGTGDYIFQTGDVKVEESLSVTDNVTINGHLGIGTPPHKDAPVRVYNSFNDIVEFATEVNGRYAIRSSSASKFGDHYFFSSAGGSIRQYNGIDMIKVNSAGVIINEDSQDLDFRIESDTDLYAFNLRGSDGFIGIGTQPSGSKLLVSGDARLKNDNDKIILGAGYDSSILYNGSDMVFNSQEVGTGDYVFATGDIRVEEDVEISGDLDVIGSAIIDGMFLNAGAGGVSNVVLGKDTGRIMEVGATRNTLIGKDAGEVVTTGDGNTLIGYLAGARQTTTSWSTYVGDNAGGNQVGTNNAFFGAFTGLGVNGQSTGSNNLGIGTNALTKLLTGNNNMVIGVSSGISLEHGDDNAFIGGGSGASVVNGNDNTFIGRSSGGTVVDGDGNIMIGNRAGLAIGDISNVLMIDNSDRNDSLIFGDFSGRNITINGDLEVTGNVTATYYFGNGSQLTGITSTDTKWDGNLTSPSGVNTSFSKVDANNLFSIKDNVTSVATMGNAIQLDGTDEDGSNSGFANQIYPFTIIAWYKADGSAIATYQTIVNKGSMFNTDANFDFGVRDTSTNRVYFYIRDGGTIRGDEIAHTDVFDNEWHQIAVVVNSSNIAQLYFDGATLGSTFDLVDNPDTNTDDLSIGGWQGTQSNSANFEGDVDEVAIWSTELSANDISDQYNSGTGLQISTSDTFPTDATPMNTNLEVLYHFDEVSGTTGSDSSGNSLDLTMNNIDNSNWVLGIIPTVIETKEINVLQSRDGTSAGDFGAVEVGDDVVSLTLNGNRIVQNVNSVLKYLLNETIAYFYTDVKVQGDLILTNGTSDFRFSKLSQNSMIDGSVFGISMTNPPGNEIPHFWIQSGGAEQASGIARSFMIVDEDETILSGENRSSCQTWANHFNKTLMIDCNTTTTGADLLVGDDMQVFGTVFTQEYTPNAYVAVTGTLDSGDLDDLTDMLGNEMVFNEVSGTPGFDIRFNITANDIKPKWVVARWGYDGGSGHQGRWDVYDYDSTTWKTIRTFTDDGGLGNSMTMLLPNNLAGSYLDGNNVFQIRAYHTSSGNPGHDLNVDYIGVKY